MQQIYTKKGNKTYKEKPLIEAIRKAILANPELDNKFPPANNFEELKALHLKICATDVEFSETTNEEEQDFDNPKPTNSKNDDDDYIPENIPDPINADDPIVRNYVLDNTFDNPETQTAETSQTEFAEPINFTEAFEMPEGLEEDGPIHEKKLNQATNSGTQQNIKVPHSATDSSSQEKTSQSSSGSHNFASSSDEMDPAKKRKQTRKLAKYIVDTGCMLLEKGFVWFATKDINESVLNQLEAEGEIDLSLELELSNEQTIVAREFFKNQCLDAEKIAKIDAEEKEDLANALAEVMLEKNIALTPMQQLGLVGLKILAVKGAEAYMWSKQNQAVVEAIRVRNNQYREAPSQPAPAASSPDLGEEEGSFEETAQAPVATEDLLLGAGEIATKE